MTEIKYIVALNKIDPALLIALALDRKNAPDIIGKLTYEEANEVIRYGSHMNFDAEREERLDRRFRQTVFTAITILFIMLLFI